jgi:hypothetical protein
MVAAAVGYGALIYWAATSDSAWAWFAFSLATAAALSIALLLYLRRHRHPTASEAPLQAVATPDDGSYRVLVVVDDGSTSAAFREQLVRSAGGRPTKALVVAPALSSRLGRWTGDQAAYDDATTHLDETLGALAALGVEADGRIGAHDPLQAIDDGLRAFPADAVVFATHADAHANWLEQGVVEAVRSRCSVPVEHVVLDESI